MGLILVDSSFYVSLSLTGDSNHNLAKKIADKMRMNQVTTEDFIKESLTILSQRRGKNYATSFYQKLTLNTKIIPTSNVFQEALGLFMNPRINKNISLIDCTGASIYRKINANYILTFDKHFKDLGCKIVQL